MSRQLRDLEYAREGTVIDDSSSPVEKKRVSSATTGDCLLTALAPAAAEPAGRLPAGVADKSVPVRRRCPCFPKVCTKHFDFHCLTCVFWRRLFASFNKIYLICMRKTYHSWRLPVIIGCSLWHSKCRVRKDPRSGNWIASLLQTGCPEFYNESFGSGACLHGIQLAALGDGAPSSLTIHLLWSVGQLQGANSTCTCSDSCMIVRASVTCHLPVLCCHG